MVYSQVYSPQPIISARFCIGFCIHDATSSYWGELVSVRHISPKIQSLWQENLPDNIDGRYTSNPMHSIYRHIQYRLSNYYHCMYSDVCTIIMPQIAIFLYCLMQALMLMLFL